MEIVEGENQVISCLKVVQCHSALGEIWGDTFKGDDKENWMHSGRKSYSSVKQHKENWMHSGRKSYSSVNI